MYEIRIAGISTLYLAKLVNGQHIFFFKLRSSSLWTCLHHMAILKSENKNTDLLLI